MTAFVSWVASMLASCVGGLWAYGVLGFLHDGTVVALPHFLASHECKLAEFVKLLTMFDQRCRGRQVFAASIEPNEEHRQMSELTQV